MKSFVLVIFIFNSLPAICSVFDRDTIDNWQIYNNEKLLLSGHDLGPDTYETTIQKSSLEYLTIKYNHCTVQLDPYVVTIEITNHKSQIILTKTCKINSWEPVTILKNEFVNLETKFIVLRYKEPNTGTDQLLGRIRLK